MTSIPASARSRLPLPLGYILAALVSVLLAGCEEEGSSLGHLERVWSCRGLSDGRLQKPRAMTIDTQDHIYIVDMTARVQVFDTQGTFLRGWKTPECVHGKPTGISVNRKGQILVADTHYYRILIYSSDGELVQTIGGMKGDKPGEFGLVTAAVQDSDGNYYISEYGEYDRVQKVTSDGKFLRQWGGHGSEPGQFSRPQKLALDEEEHLWVADACNHRIQVFDKEGQFLRAWGTQGQEPGQLYYPYDLVLAPGNTVYVAEFGNHRVQKFTRDGRPLGCWGAFGRKEGQLNNPWAVVRDSHGYFHVLDTNNHRVQTIRM